MEYKQCGCCPRPTEIEVSVVQKDGTRRGHTSTRPYCKRCWAVVSQYLEDAEGEALHAEARRPGTRQQASA